MHPRITTHRLGIVGTSARFLTGVPVLGKRGGVSANLTCKAIAAWRRDADNPIDGRYASPFGFSIDDPFKAQRDGCIEVVL